MEGLPPRTTTTIRPSTEYPRSGQTSLSTKKLRWQDGGRYAGETKLFNDWAPERFGLIGPVLVIEVNVTERSRAGSVGGILIATSASSTSTSLVAEATGGITYIAKGTAADDRK